MVDAETHRRLLRHEAEVHAIPGRVLRDLGDAFLLHDPVEPEPFWNRLEAIVWPAAAAAFDRRLSEVLVLFASVGRQPHVWLSPPFDRPADIEARLLANGFADMGHGLLMVARDGERAREALAERPPEPDVSIERLAALEGPGVEAVAGDVVDVLLSAFAVGLERRAGLVAETMATLVDRRFTHYLVRRSGEPSAVLRSATFDGVSYLSSIGTVPGARDLGLGRLVTATATVDAVRAGSELVHLGVYVDNAPARHLYERLGFVISGEPAPDLLLV